ncbi:MAG: chlorite dismutase family protein [Chloroflexi bacterium]|nr:chlorite dismutase family protein [Chloroflexota bacterium]
MNGTDPKILSHFSIFKFKDEYVNLRTIERKKLKHDFSEGVQSIATNVEIFQVYPTNMKGDILIWCALEADEPVEAERFFTTFSQATNPFRHVLDPVFTLWGFTKPSQYTKTRSTQEIDPFSKKRKPYLVIYPFAKTPEWYLMSREARQGMMNEHIKIGKQYPEIKQLLLYSFGLQDQEFVVVYETDDLTKFSDLVYELRDTEARRYTLFDTPVITAIYHPAEETLNLWA